MKRYFLPIMLTGLMAIGVLFVFAAPSAFVKAASGVASDGGASSRQFVVKGEATSPTVEGAYVNFTVEATAAEGATAQSDALRAIDRVKTALKKIGVGTDQATLGPYRLTPVKEGKTTLFKATQTVRVMLSSAKSLGQVLDTALRSGAVSASGGMAPPTSVSDKVRREAVVAAIKDAREKARLLAGAFNIQLGGAQKVSILNEGPKLSPNGSFGWNVTVKVHYAY